MEKDTPAPLEFQVEFTLNGQAVRAIVPENRTLLRFLRDDLRLTGVKNGCSSGHCGACTVILNGKAARSCLVKMSRVQGAVVETIEGLGKEGALHPLQQAYIEKDAVQCGFCTPGSILSARALLDENPQPSLEEIKAHLTRNSNICRCTGYVKIFEAIQLAAGRMAGTLPPPVPQEGEVIDNSRRRASAEAAVRGKIQYGDDIYVEGMLHGRILFSAHPHANILDIDTREAQAAPGVACVLTHRDIPGKNVCGIIVRDMPAWAQKKVNYIGDPVATVFAETPEAAEAALQKIRVEYEVLPGVFSIEEASHPDAPRIKEEGNLCHDCAIQRGDVEAAFQKCDVIIEEDYATPFVEHGFMEPESGFAFVNEEGVLVVQVGSQSIFADREQLMDILDLPQERVRVIQLPTGGAFGGKEDPVLLQHLGLGALKTGRPVKMVLTREESLRVHAKRHPAKMHYKSGCTRDGKVLALQARVLLDSGAYTSLSIDVLENTIVFGAGPYFIPNLDLRGEAWFTNNVLSGAMRGFGVNQVAVAMEQQMDAMARAIGMDPFEFRRLNALDVGLPSASDHVMEKGVVSIKETIDACEAAFRSLPLPATRPGKKIGYGVASAVKNVGFGHGGTETAGAILEMNCGGNILLKHSQHEYGQGAAAGLTKLVMIELGALPESITVVGPDTALTPPTGATTASRQTFLTGNAVVLAARALREELAARAAEELEIPPERLRVQGSRVVDPESGRSVELCRLGDSFRVARTYSMPRSVDIPRPGHPSLFGRPGFSSMTTHVCYAYSTQAAVVEVDEESGEVKVLTIIAACDVGKVLNREAVIGQIQGAVMMGLGMALSEQFIVEKGVNLTNTLHKVRLPKADMTPDIQSVIVEVPHPFGPEGVKGFAEAPSLSTAPAILNAIYDAVGVRIHETPADKARVLAALKYR